MRGVIVAGVLLVTMLSGCSSGSSLQAFLMQPGEAPQSCSLMDYDSEDGRFLQEAFNWTGNPGSVDNEVFAEDGQEPTGNIVELFECDEGEIASIVLQFADLNATHEYIGEDEDGSQGFCDDDGSEAGIVAGNTVAFVEGDDDIAGMKGSLDRWLGRVSAQAGVPNPCQPQGDDDARAT